MKYCQLMALTVTTGLRGDCAVISEELLWCSQKGYLGGQRHLCHVSSCLLTPGHEAAFAAFLCCLCKIGVLRVDDQMAIVFKVFNR